MIRPRFKTKAGCIALAWSKHRLLSFDLRLVYIEMFFGRNIGETICLPWPPWVTHNTDKIISVCGFTLPKMAKASTVVIVLCRWCRPYRAKLRQWKYGLEDGGGLPLELLTFYAKKCICRIYPLVYFNRHELSDLARLPTQNEVKNNTRN